MSAMRMARMVARGKFLVDAEHFAGEEGKPSRDFARMAAQLVPSAVCVDIANVIEYVAERGEADGRGVTADDIEGALCPWPWCWLEGSTDSPLGLVRLGILVMSNPAEDDLRGLSGVMGLHADQYLRFGPGDFIVSSILWTWGEGRDQPFGPEAISTVVLTPDGSIARDDAQEPGDRGRLQIMTKLLASDGGPEYQELTGVAVALLPLVVFQFANCRNVDVVEVLPTRQARRAAERIGHPIDKHYVLAIGGETITRPGQNRMAPTAKRETRLHICRGHFATYTEEAKLFGKHVGRYWIPAHVRGLPHRGIVSKTYAVESP